MKNEYDIYGVINPPGTFSWDTTPYLGGKYLRRCPAPAHFGRRDRRRSKNALGGPFWDQGEVVLALASGPEIDVFAQFWGILGDFGRFLPKRGAF